MSSHPNVYISASFFVGEGIEELSDKIDNCEADIDCQIARDGNDIGIDGNFEEGYLTVYEYLIYGWGNSLNDSELSTKMGKFKIKIRNLCHAEGFGNPTFKIGANFY